MSLQMLWCTQYGKLCTAQGILKGKGRKILVSTEEEMSSDKECASDHKGLNTVLLIDLFKCSINIEVRGRKNISNIIIAT